MTKREKHRSINREFFEKYNNEFHIDDDGDGGSVTLSIIDQDLEKEFTMDGSYPSDHYIEYHKSRHYVFRYNRANDHIHDKVDEMGVFLKQLIKKYEL